MRNWPRADYLQVLLGRVKNSISSAQALGTGVHRGGLFLVNKGEMASHFTVTAGRGHRFVYIPQRGSDWAPLAGGRGRESKREQVFQSRNSLSLAIGPDRKRRASSEHPGRFLKLVFIFS